MRTLSQLGPGRPARIDRVIEPSGRLAALGFLSGSRIVVLRTSPLFIVRVEDTKVALARAIADRILVCREEKPGRR